METVKTGKEKQLAYVTEYRQFNKALKEAFYLEAIAIGYAIIEDRLVAFLHHAGIVSRQKPELRINRCIYPYMRSLLNKNDDYSIRIKDISVKTNLICNLLSLSEQRADEIDNEVAQFVKEKKKKSIAKKGYMSDLRKQVIKTVDCELIIDSFYDIEPWRKERNKLIHALLNNKVESSKVAKKICAEKALELTRQLDNCLVKPFKSGNHIRKKYMIQ